LDRTERLKRALAAIDSVNAGDPNRIVARGEERPKELAHAEMVSAWVEKLHPNPSEALCLAARAHHIKRWFVPRSDYPSGLAGYSRWRRALQAFHAKEVAQILAAQGYDAATIERVGDLVRKKGLGRDAEVQALEDAMCLVFVETQFHALAARLPQEKVIDVTRKTLRKMSAPAIAEAIALPLDPEDLELLERAARM
jgi:hypothetical protein